MRRTLLWLLALLSIGLVAAGGLALWPRRAPGAPPRPMRWPSLISETEARRRFLAEHPGARPLNWAIGDAALRFHDTQPMGAFVLGLGEPGNDCSDFVACCIDEGLGVRARFRRDSQQHLLGERQDLFEYSWWQPQDDVQPGDVLSVRHSPWYEPYDGACWHCGIVGSDGYVYDFSKLRRWSSPRYGRHTVDEFTKHSRGEHQVLLQRLHYLYRYRLRPLPGVSSAPGPPATGRRPAPARPSRGSGQEG
ncbi:MAG: hypothetical protein HZB16_22265 [Armatimonadetes bacterium]|nr:hypothetical protein [Armatimonadota bacterium]